MPTLSVVIPTYNRSVFLAHAMRSVLAQTFAEFELVVTDNGSTDDTAAVVSTFADPRVRYLRHDRNRGMVPNWNAGIRQSSGRYVALLEDDNWWEPEFLARTVAVLEGQPDVGFVYTAAFLTGPDTTVREVHLRWATDQTRPGLEELRDLIRGNKILLSTVVVRRASLDAVGLFDESIRYAADWEMWMRLALRYASAFVAAPLAYYRRHDASGTAQIHATPYALFIDHRMIIDQTLRRVRAAGDRRLAGELRHLAYRWLADLQADRAMRSYVAGDLRRARGEALLALRCGPDAWGSAELRRVLYALLPFRIVAPLRNLWRRVDHAVRRRARAGFRGLP